MVMVLIRNVKQNIEIAANKMNGKNNNKQQQQTTTTTLLLFFLQQQQHLLRILSDVKCTCTCRVWFELGLFIKKEGGLLFSV
jgi:hypothetical protein